MLDTFMVLWTRGICNRFLQTLATFLCLFTGICVMLFLVTASGIRWPGLAITVTPTGASATPAAFQATATPVQASLTLPPILQNPTPTAPRFRIHHFAPVVVPTPVSGPTAPPDAQQSPTDQTIFP